MSDVWRHTCVCKCVYVEWFNLLFCCQKANLINIRHLQKNKIHLFLLARERRIKNYYWYLLSDFEIIFHQQMSLSSSKSIFKMLNRHREADLKNKITTIFENLHTKLYYVYFITWVYTIEICPLKNTDDKVF